jgi:hypothetical protein
MQGREKNKNEILCLGDITDNEAMSSHWGEVRGRKYEVGGALMCYLKIIFWASYR